MECRYVYTDAKYTACWFNWFIVAEYTVVIYDQTFSLNWLSKDDYIFLICQQKMTASFWHKSIH